MIQISLSKMAKYGNKKLTYQGINFDSKLELYTYQLFKNEGFDIQRDTEPLVLMDKFQRYNILKGKMVTERAITYTCDFTLYRYPFCKPLKIECKGFVARDYPLRKKMFLSRYSGEYDFVQVKNQKEVIALLEVLRKE